MHSTLEQIEGTVERIVYSNEENLYTVAHLVPEVKGRAEPITIVGNLASLNIGESLRAFGRWVTHKQFGRQFAVEKYESVLPRTVVGIKKYMASGLIKGIGATYAERIVDTFGEQTFEVIDQFSARLREVEGIGEERARRIKEAWRTQKVVRDIMIFLQGYGVGSSHASKIFKRYGDTAIEVVRENPFRLARDITGIGFITADGIASKLGVARDSIHRLKAGVLHTLEEATNHGNICLPQDVLIKEATALLDTAIGPIEDAIRQLSISGDVVIDEEMVYLTGLYRCEISVANRIYDIRNSNNELPAIDLNKAIPWVQDRTGISLAESQQQAIRTALASKLSVITGGPGVGKTTIINSIVKILLAKKCEVLLAAPTGRAAKRMSEATGIPAQTIHRLLKYEPQAGGFVHNERRPLKADMVIVDETSMLDIPLAYHLLKAIPQRASVVFVGDVDQLPSVGPGNFLPDLIVSDLIPVVRLTEIFRQAKDSFIITNAHRVNEGQLPTLTDSKESDFFFIEAETPEDALATIKTLAAERIPNRFRLNSLGDVQILTPMHRGLCGSENLNRELQTVLNPNGPTIQRYGRLYRVHDRVMQTRNNYDKDVFNGDLGRIKRIDLVEQQVFVEIDGKEIIYEFNDLDELVPAYAISVHKSQGNEYPAVIIPILTQHFVLLQRNLLYTAITRGKRLVVIVGSKKALAIAVRNNKTMMRYSRLEDRLRSKS